METGAGAGVRGLLGGIVELAEGDVAANELWLLRSSEPIPTILRVTGDNSPKSRPSPKHTLQMKTTHIILAAVLAATSAIQAASAEHRLPAPLPEFKTPEQLVKWRHEMTAKAVAADAVASTQFNSAFYTGKPFLKETGCYAFKFRQYDPELSRWTTTDPSGFPDGANPSVYASIPTTGYDPYGLYSESDALADAALVALARGGFQLAGYTMSDRRALLALNYGDNETAPAGEINELKSSSYFSDKFNKGYFSRLVGSVGSSSPYTKQDIIIEYNGGTDLNLSYGKVPFGVTGEFTWSNNQWSTVAHFSFIDLYDFQSSYNPAIAAFGRMQANHYAGTYNTTGTFDITFNE